jgi:hypothetical protein
MNNIAKKIGITTLVIALICNLQYSFFNVNDNPSAAKAGWTDMYGTAYCGNSPDTSYYPGEWFWLDTTPCSGNNAYDFYGIGYIYYFVRVNTGTSECGPNETASLPWWNYQGNYVTAPTHPVVYF